MSDHFAPLPVDGLLRASSKNSSKNKQAASVPWTGNGNGHQLQQSLQTFESELLSNIKVRMKTHEESLKESIETMFSKYKAIGIFEGHDGIKQNGVCDLQTVSESHYRQLRPQPMSLRPAEVWSKDDVQVKVSGVPGAVPELIVDPPEDESPTVPQTPEPVLDGTVLDRTISSDLSPTTDEGHDKKKKTKKKSKKASFLLAMANSLDDSSRLQKLVASRYYEAVNTLLITTNSVFIGWQTQFSAARAESNAENNKPQETDIPLGFLVLQIVYCACFTVDLILRWLAEGPIDFAFRSKEVAWNLMDIFVVFVSVVDLLFEFALMVSGQETEETVFSSFSVLKVLRVIRLVRVARVIRTMKCFRELRMMVYSIMGCMRSLLWVLLVLGLLFYLFGISFCIATTEHLKTSEMWNDPGLQDLRDHFGTLDRAMMSLYMSMSGGNDWAIYYESIRKTSHMYSTLFLFFITFSTFAVVNIVTGVFVESAMQANLADKDIIVHEEMQAKREYLEEVREMFEALDVDCTGTITLQELEQGLAEEKVYAYFCALKIDVSDAKTLFRMLDTNRSNAITIDEFVNGCYRLQGEATSFEMKLSILEVQSLRDRVEKMTDLLQQNLSAKPAHIKTNGGLIL